MLHSFTRLVIGGVAVGYDSLRSRLQVWDTQRQGAVKETPPEPPIALPPVAAAPTERPVLPAAESGGVEVVENPAAVVIIPAPVLPESERDRLRYALIGAVFAAQDRTGRGLRQAGRLTRVAGNLAELLVGPVYNSRLLSPLRSQIDTLAERGQQEVEHWIELGRYEDETSRELARAALYERVDNAIDYLTSNDEVQELVQSQSVGLVDEVVEEARERTVSADNFLESMVRTMLRRPQRWELPDPPEAIRKQAQLPQKVHGKVVKP